MLCVAKIKSMYVFIDLNIVMVRFPSLGSEDAKLNDNRELKTRKWSLFVSFIVVID